MKNSPSLHFFLETYHYSKTYVSNIKIRICFPDGTPKRMQKTEKGWEDNRENGSFKYHMLFHVEKWYSWYRLCICDRLGGSCVMPIRSYNTLEEAFKKAEEIWDEMQKDLDDEDIQVRDSVICYNSVKTERIENFIKKHNCKDVELGGTYHGKTTVTWKNTTYAY